jgi:hypothetical protein
MLAITTYLLCNLNIAEAATCDAIIDLAHEEGMPLLRWTRFPVIGLPMGDPRLSFYVNDFRPIAEKMWRYIKHIEDGTKIINTQYTAFRITPIDTIEEVPPPNYIYVPLSVSKSQQADHGNQGFSDEASKKYIQALIDNGDELITSAPVNMTDYKTKFGVVYALPIRKNIKQEDIFLDKLSIAFFDSITNLRVDRASLIEKELLEEIKNGCLEGRAGNCSVLEVGAKSAQLGPDGNAFMSNAEIKRSICK